MRPFEAWLGPIRLFTGPRPADEPWWLILGPAGLTGWRVRAQDRSDSTPHWSGVGSVASGQGSEARQITIEGHILGTQAGAPEAGLDAVTRLSRTTLTVAEDARGVTRCADVRVVQMQETRISEFAHRITISLVADDPLRYSAEARVLADGINHLPNRGDAIAFPRLVLTGPTGPVSIAHTFGTWTFPALLAGQERQIDFRELRVWNGNTRVFGEGSGPAPRIEPGGCLWVVSGTATGRAVLSRGEAWS